MSSTVLSKIVDVTSREGVGVGVGLAFALKALGPVCAVTNVGAVNGIPNARQAKKANITPALMSFVVASFLISCAPLAN